MLVSLRPGFQPRVRFGGSVGTARPIGRPIFSRPPRVAATASTARTARRIFAFVRWPVTKHVVIRIRILIIVIIVVVIFPTPPRTRPHLAVEKGKLRSKFVVQVLLPSHRPKSAPASARTPNAPPRPTPTRA